MGHQHIRPGFASVGEERLQLCGDVDSITQQRVQRLHQPAFAQEQRRFLVGCRARLRDARLGQSLPDRRGPLGVGPDHRVGHHARVLCAIVLPAPEGVAAASNVLY